MSYAQSVPVPGRGAGFPRPTAGPWALAAAGLASTVILAALISKVGVLAALGLAVVALGAMILLLAFPFGGVLLGVFVLYTNLPAAAARQGAIPEEATALVGIFFVPALVQQLVARRESLRLDRTFCLMIAFLAVMLVSTAIAAVNVETALDHIVTHFLAEGVAVFLLVLNTVRDRAALTRVLTVIVVAAAFLATLSTYQSVTGNVHQQFFGLAERTVEHLEGRPELGHEGSMGREARARGPVDEANRFAQILLIAASFALALAWTRRGLGRAAALGAMALMLSAMFLTYSRGAFVTLVLLVLFLGALRIIPRRHLVVGLLAGLLLVPVVAPGYADRLHSIAGAQGLVSTDAAVEPDGATRGRTTAMLATLLAFSEHPVFGVGPGQYWRYHSVSYQLRPEIAFRELAVPRRAHNLVLETAADTGLVGLLIFMAIPLLLLRDLWRIRKRAPPERPDIQRLALGFILALLAYLGTAMFLHLSYHRYYWLLIGLAAAAVWIMRREVDEDRRRWTTTGADGGAVRYGGPPSRALRSEARP